ncbi:MAG: CRISPR-associated endonuclease Cas2 [Anaerolineales bacterium]|nr:CRISPR-associated endonuclease Cas2 [Anaerolineales bacterium]MCS7248930.1 CRISPR-associated endonuclease Cas2 [Anaerolineales bacterium]MDW8162743.1 CRISPR-associated endonuclease Cas2 [Anaerolineales bacterium]MDW8447852.1 CRISPR-associated endonuclease Cas2 [Anaerolineales bacterium]
MVATKAPNTLVIYDIPDDRRRTKVAEVCLDYGLDRIQFSAFLGWLLPTQQEELFLKLKKTLGKQKGNIQLFNICLADWRRRKVLDQSGAKDGEGVSGGATR